MAQKGIQLVKDDDEQEYCLVFPDDSESEWAPYGEVLLTEFEGRTLLTVYGSDDETVNGLVPGKVYVASDPADVEVVDSEDEDEDEDDELEVEEGEEAEEEEEGVIE